MYIKINEDLTQEYTNPKLNALILLWLYLNFNQSIEYCTFELKQTFHYVKCSHSHIHKFLGPECGPSDFF